MKIIAVYFSQSHGEPQASQATVVRYPDLRGLTIEHHAAGGKHIGSQSFGDSTNEAHVQSIASDLLNGSVQAWIEPTPGTITGRTWIADIYAGLRLEPDMQITGTLDECITQAKAELRGRCWKEVVA